MIRLEDLQDKHLGKQGKVDIGFGQNAHGKITDFYGIIDEDSADAKVLIEFNDHEYYVLDAETLIHIS